MYVCVCRAITEKQIRIRRRRRLARLRDLRVRLGVTENAGGVPRCAKQCLHQALDKQHPPSSFRTASRTFPVIQEAA